MQKAIGIFTIFATISVFVSAISRATFKQLPGNFQAISGQLPSTVCPKQALKAWEVTSTFEEASETEKEAQKQTACS